MGEIKVKLKPHPVMPLQAFFRLLTALAALLLLAGCSRDLLEAAESGDLQAQYELGAAFASGDGVPLNLQEAIHWYRQAAEKGHIAAQLNLGLAYSRGEGVAADPVEAVRWYRKAADQGDADAQFNLAYAYSHGRGVSKDPLEAKKWLRKSEGRKEIEDPD
jgi:TPR repeat protein